MTGINKVTPSRTIQPVKPGSKHQERKKPSEPVEKAGLEDNTTETKSQTPVKHIDERI